MKSTLVILFFLLFISAFKKSNDLLFKIPENWPKPEYDFSKNALTPDKIQLGRILFYDPLLSRNNTISCSSCHSPFTAFAHIDHQLSHGIDNKIGTRNAAALTNLAWQKTFMWDGGVNHLDVQPLAPIANADEMDETLGHVLEKLNHSKIYPGLFYKAWGDSNITSAHFLKSVSQFMLTIVSANSKYDSVMRKQSIFTEQENNGYRLFKQNCATCHQEPLFTNGKFENNGLPSDSTLKDTGRMKVTGNPQDSLTFKVPSLRNIEYSYPYMHDGRFKNLGAVLNHYTKGISQSNTLSVQLQKSIVLSSNEKVDIIAFLLTLTDRKFIFDKKYSYPGDIFYPKAQE